jgi:hypothetical protein
LLSVVVPSYAFPEGLSRPPSEEDEHDARRVQEARRADVAGETLSRMGARATTIERCSTLEAATREAVRDLDPDLVVLGPDGRAALDLLPASEPGITPLRSGFDVLLLNRRL